ncbi:MAG: dTMP kinase [Candidatus Paceibacterota bacterium]
MPRGKFIVLDSGEGAGKTLQLERVQKHFGDRVLVTREPGGSKYAEQIRELILHSVYAQHADAKTLFALFWASRADHLAKTIIPALEAGKTVITDRFDSSTYAYQIIAQGAGELKDLFWKVREVYLGEWKPDLYVYLDVDPAIGLARKSGQGPEELNHFEARQLEFHQRQRVGCKEFMTKVPHRVIDASKSIDGVWEDFRTVLEEQIKI